MDIVEFIELPYDEVCKRASKLGFSKAVATRAYNLAKLANARNVIKNGVPCVKGIGSKTLEFIDAI